MATTMPAASHQRYGDVHRVLPLKLDGRVHDGLNAALAPYLRSINEFIASGNPFPSHIPGSGCLAVPIGESMTPAEMFAVLGDRVKYQVHEYEGYWITVHYPNPEPVVTLLPKRLPGVPPAIAALTERCAQVMGCPVGGPDGTFLAYLLPGFSWAMHTDHDNDYELVEARLHVPLMTTPESLFVWGQKNPDGAETWRVRRHLRAGRVHLVRVDVPHTVINAHPSRPRLHLIFDVHTGDPAVRYRPRFSGAHGHPTEGEETSCVCGGRAAPNRGRPRGSLDVHDRSGEAGAVVRRR